MSLRDDIRDLKVEVSEKSNQVKQKVEDSSTELKREVHDVKTEVSSVKTDVTDLHRKVRDLQDSINGVSVNTEPPKQWFFQKQLSKWNEKGIQWSNSLLSHVREGVVKVFSVIIAILLAFYFFSGSISAYWGDMSDIFPNHNESQSESVVTVKNNSSTPTKKASNVVTEYTVAISEENLSLKKEKMALEKELNLLKKENDALKQEKKQLQKNNEHLKHQIKQTAK